MESLQKEFTNLNGLKIGLVLTGSFCTFQKAFEAAEKLISYGAEIIPVMSYNAANIDTRFGKASEHIARLEKLSGHKVIRDIAEAEPIGPKNYTDVMLVAPCTGNTAAKLVLSVTDTPATMAVKSHLRGGKPVIICIATNDGLSNTAKNIGSLMNYKHYYFVPLVQDDPVNKPSSIVADFDRIPETISLAAEGKQIQNVL
jgi:dipicolinate synthase subunit B